MEGDLQLNPLVEVEHAQEESNSGREWRIETEALAGDRSRVDQANDAIRPPRGEEPSQEEESGQNQSRVEHEQHKASGEWTPTRDDSRRSDTGALQAADPQEIDSNKPKGGQEEDFESQERTDRTTEADDDSQVAFVSADSADEDMLADPEALNSNKLKGGQQGNVVSEGKADGTTEAVAEPAFLGADSADEYMPTDREKLNSNKLKGGQEELVAPEEMAEGAVEAVAGSAFQSADVADKEMPADLEELGGNKPKGSEKEDVASGRRIDGATEANADSALLRAGLADGDTEEARPREIQVPPPEKVSGEETGRRKGGQEEDVASEERADGTTEVNADSAFLSAGSADGNMDGHATKTESAEDISGGESQSSRHGDDEFEEAEEPGKLNRSGSSDTGTNTATSSVSSTAGSVDQPRRNEFPPRRQSSISDRESTVEKGPPQSTEEDESIQGEPETASPLSKFTKIRRAVIGLGKSPLFGCWVCFAVGI